MHGLHPYYGHAVKDHPLIAIGKVRFVGEPVAAVIAEDELSAQEALGKIAVEYEETEAILDVDTALAPKELRASTKRISPTAPSAASTISRARRETFARQCTSSGAMWTRRSLRPRTSPKANFIFRWCTRTPWSRTWPSPITMPRDS